MILTPSWRNQVLAQTLSLLRMRIILTTVNGCGQYYLSKTTVRKSTKDLAELAPTEMQNLAFFFFFLFAFDLSMPICQKVHVEFQFVNE